MKMLYQVQIQPSQLVSLYVRQCKQYIHQRVGKFKFINSDPHISLFSFEADEQAEPLVIKAVRKAAAQVATFKVAMNGFSHFKQSKTIFLKVENADEVNYLNQIFFICFQSAAEELGLEVNGDLVIDKPHLTIGGGFDNKAFASLYGVFATEIYRQEFSVDQAVLLKYMGRGQNKLMTRASFSKSQKQAIKSNDKISLPAATGQMTLGF